jgi:hypothetical protein
MEEKKPVIAFSPEDLKRRRSRAKVMAWCLAALIVLFFVTTLVNLGGAGRG